MFLPDEDGVRRNPGVGVHGDDFWFVQTSDGRRVVIPSEQEARARWREERPKLFEMWLAEHAARKRFDVVVSKIRLRRSLTMDHNDRKLLHEPAFR